MKFKKTLCIILTFILVFSSFFVINSDGNKVLASTEELHKTMGGNGLFYDADGYKIIPLGKKWTLGPVSGVYDDYVTNVSWSTTNKNVVSLKNSWDRYCTVMATGVGVCSVNGCVESYYPLNADLQYMDNIHKFRVAQPAISILAHDMSINAGKTKMLNIKSTPSGNYSFYACEPVFTSSNPAVAKVDWKGNITALKKGKTTITVKTSNGLTTKCKITVKIPAVKKIKITKSQVTIQKGKTKQLKAKFYPQYSSAKVKWSSSNNKIATINSKGLIKAKKAGKVTITAKVNSKIKSSCKITVLNQPKSIKLNKSTAIIRKGDTLKLKYTVKPKNAYVNVKWTSSDTSVATVNAKGVVVGVSTGTAKITATTSNGKRAVCTVTVKLPLANSVKLSKNTLTLSVKESEILNTYVSPVNYEGKLEWSTNNSAVATVDENGKINAIGVGTAIITAKVNSKAHDECVVEVNDLPLDPYKYLEFKAFSRASYAIDHKRIFANDYSGLGFEICQDSAKSENAYNGYTYLSDASIYKTDIIYNSKNYEYSINLNFSSKFEEDNITKYRFNIIFDDVKYLVTVANSNWYEFEAT